MNSSIAAASVWRGVVVAVAVAVGGCGSGHASPDGTVGNASPAAAPLVTLSLAASTRDAVREVVAQFEKETGARVNLNAGASSALGAQARAGAPVDLFLSASPEWIEALDERGLVRASCKLLSNRLVIVAPRDNPAGVASPEDLLSEQVHKLALAGAKVPAGQYADQVLASFGLTEALASKIVRGSDVRVTLSYVERGEAEAGIVYATDAQLSSAVRAVYQFPDTSHGPIVYPLALLKYGQTNPAAGRLFDYLQSPPAQTIFAQHGFLPHPSSSVKTEH